MKKIPTVTIKQNPIVIVRNFMLLQFGGYVAFVGVGALADYGAIYGGLSLGGVLSYELAYLIFILVAELAITAFIFLEWNFAYYQISTESVLSARGIFSRRKTSLSLSQVDLVSHEYGLLGKLLRYGTIIVQGSSGNSLRLPYVSEPQKYSALIMRFKKTGHRPVSLEVSNPPQPEALLHRQEDEHLEFKSTMRWDIRSGQVSRTVEKMVVKTIAGFLNSGGGNLVIGVDDARQVVGLDHDYRSLTKQDRDGFENHFTHVFNSTIGAEFRSLVKLHFAEVNGKEVCMVNVKPAVRPAYVRFDKDEEFYVRTGNSTTPLSLSEANSYLDLWKTRLS